MSSPQRISLLTWLIRARLERLAAQKEVTPVP